MRTNTIQSLLRKAKESAASLAFRDSNANGEMGELVGGKTRRHILIQGWDAGRLEVG